MIGSRRLTYEYPHYSVICPQTGFTFDVRTLNVQEVNQLKGSMMVQTKTPSLINKIIWGAIESKPDDISDLDTFKKMITLRDREAILYGIYCFTFGDEEEFKVMCRKCEHEEHVKISMEKLFSMNAYPGSESIKNSYKIARITGDADYDPEIEKAITDTPPKGMPKNIAKFDYKIDAPDDDDGIIIGEKGVEYVEDEPTPPVKIEEPIKVSTPQSQYTSILDKRIDIILPISKVHAILKQPTLLDEENSLKSIAFAQKKQNDLINEIMVIERFEQYNAGDKVPSVVISEKEDILFEYEKLPPRDKTEIFKRFYDEFGQYGIDLKTRYACSKCGESNELEVDIVVQFFRLVARS